MAAVHRGLDVVRRSLQSNYRLGISMRRTTGLGAIVQSMGAVALAAGKGIPLTAAAVAERRGWRDLAMEFRAAQGDIGPNGGFVIGEPRATAIIGSIPRNSLAGELADVARPLPSWLSRYLVTDSADLVAEEVPEGMPVPVAGTSASSIVIAPSKCSLMFVISEETLRDSDAAPVLESDFSIALRRGLDAVILSRLAPDSGGSLSATANPMTDMRELLGALNTTGILAPIIVPAVDVALRMSTLRDAGGAIFPEMGLAGGQALGNPAFTNDQLPAGSMRAINGEAIGFRVSGIEVATSQNTSVEMNTAPTQDGNDGAGAQMVSMFQNYAVAVKFTVSFALAVLRDGLASSELTGIDW
jgi:hypothetical protein